MRAINGYPYSIAQSIYLEVLNSFLLMPTHRDAAVEVTGLKHVFVLPRVRGKYLFANWKNGTSSLLR